MSGILTANADYALKIRTIMKLRYEPVAIKLIQEGEEIPGYEKPEKQMSHCQSIMRARKGECLKLKPEDLNCHVGSSAQIGRASCRERV